MATNPGSLMYAPGQIATIDPNAAYQQGLLLAQAQQQPANALTGAPSAAPQAAAPMQAAPQQAPMNALAMPAQGQPTQAMVDAALQAQHHKSTRDIIGGIGDALAAFGGRGPTYAPFHQQRIVQQAFADWQANPDNPQAQANFLAASPADAFQFQQTRRANNFAALKAGLDLQQQQRTQAQAALGAATGVLKRVRDAGGDVGAAYDQLEQGGYLGAIGMHPQESSAYRAAIVANPALIDALAPPPESVVLPGGEGAPSTLVNKTTGKAIATGVAGPVKLGPGDDLYAPTAPGSPSTGAGGAEPGTIANAGAGNVVSATNPGGIEDGPYARSQPGYAGPDPTGKFATFKTPGGGIAAQENLLRTNYLSKGVNTVNGIVDKYLGKGDSENSPASRANYKKYVASQLGVDPTAPLSGQQLRPLAAAMRAFETGATGNKVPVTSPGSIQRGAMAPAGYTKVAGNGSGQLTGPALDQAATQYVLTGQLPQGLGRGGVRQAEIINRASEISGNMSPGQIAAMRASNVADTGSLSTLENQATIVRANEGAAEKNANLILQIAPKVANGNVPIFNTWKNTAAENRGKGPIAGLDTAINTFVGQYATVMGGGTPTEGLRHEGQEMINSSQSPEQLKTTVATMQADMKNRRQAYEDERDATKQRLSSALPVPVQTPAQAAALHPGTRFITPDGRLGTR